MLQPQICSLNHLGQIFYLLLRHSFGCLLACCKNVLFRWHIIFRILYI